MVYVNFIQNKCLWKLVWIWWDNEEDTKNFVISIYGCIIHIFTGKKKTIGMQKHLFLISDIPFLHYMFKLHVIIDEHAMVIYMHAINYTLMEPRHWS